MYFCTPFLDGARWGFTHRFETSIIMRIRVLTIILVGIICLAANNCCVSSDANAIAIELKKLEKTIPLPYNDALTKGIHHYELIGIPSLFAENESFLEAELQRRNMPVELKYLPVALTDMRSDYNSGDCLGIWSIPTLVALRYGLDISADNDERLLVEPSTKAALDYLSDLHQTFGDWWLSILAFTNSPNALQTALVQNDEFLELWDFYLQDALPNTLVINYFIACDYVFGSYTPEQKAEALARCKKNEALRLADEAEKAKKEQVAKADSIAKTEPKPTNTAKPKVDYTTYTIKKGDNLGKIANKYHVTVDSLMKWNNLKSDFIREGQKLKIKR